MVIKHKNEWSYTPSEIESDAVKFFKKGIELEEDPERKSELEATRDSEMVEIKEKVKQLHWWRGVQSASFTPPPVDEAEERAYQEKKSAIEQRYNHVTDERWAADGGDLQRSSALTELDVRYDRKKIPVYSGGMVIHVQPKLQAYQTERQQIAQDFARTPDAEFFGTEQGEAMQAELDALDKEYGRGVYAPPARRVPGSELVWHIRVFEFVRRLRGMYHGLNSSTNCYCDRPFTVDEFETLFKQLRDLEGLGYSILGSSNCTIPSADKTLDRLTEEFNKVCKTYKISKCIQKIHFLCQIYWESDRFRTGLEYQSGRKYDPKPSNPSMEHNDAKSMGHTVVGDGPQYKGRGFMQLTWRKTQLKYLSYVAANTASALHGLSPSAINLRANRHERLISNDLTYAMDSAGWYWSNHKKVYFGYASNQRKYASIHNKYLNVVALEGSKYLDRISQFVNGGGNGREERREFYWKLRYLFQYTTTCKNNGDKTTISKEIELSKLDAPTLREINIRLAGFGGATPDQSVTTDTTKVVKNFQKEYMEAPATGLASRELFEAIDAFSTDTNFTFLDLLCPCGNCQGFGKGLYPKQKQDSTIQEKARKYEYPGIHRSLIFIFKAMLFYTDKYRPGGIEFVKISSGYRCHYNNNHAKPKPRTSTNHMGKAIDIHMGIRDNPFNNTYRVKACDTTRKKIFIDYCGAQLRWPANNKTSLEPSKSNAKTAVNKREFTADNWVHFDVRTYALRYLTDDLFVTSKSAAEGQPMVNIWDTKGFI